MNGKIFFILGALSGFLAVALGAFGAHGLRAKVSAEMLAIFETGARYQMVHALALLAVAWAVSQYSPALVKAAGWFFVLGSIIFSGSLYTLVLTGVKTWGAVTPIGGLLLLAGWLSLLLSAFRK